VCTIVSPTERTCDWEFTDRGLGPKLRAHLVVDANGLPTLIENSGLDYNHNPVRERFARRGDSATWSSAAEHGEHAAAGRAVYVSHPEWQSPEEQALLGRALLRAPDHTLPLLPNGEAHLERVGAIEVDNGRARKKVTHYELSGLDLAPVPLWLDEHDELYCTGDTILAGWERTGGALAKEEERRAVERRTHQMASLARAPQTPVAIVHARLFDAKSRRTVPNQTVVIEKSRFLRVGPDDKTAIPAGAERIDAAGKTLLPGLSDLHAHVGGVRLVMALAGGITTARNMATSARDHNPVLKQLDEGRAIGPRIIPVALIDGPGPGESHAELVHDAAEVKAAVARTADAGWSQIKIYNSFKPEWLPMLVSEAHRRKLRVSGHVPNGLKATDLVDAGFDELHHAYFVFLAFLPEHEMMPMARFKVFADHAGEIELSSQPVRDFIARLAQRHVVVDLTLVSGERWLFGRAGALPPTYAAVADRLPPQTRRELLAGALPPDAGSDARYRAAFRATLALAAALHRAGVPLAVGTDETLYGFSLQRELELLVEAGLRPAEALQLATLGNARILGREADLGSIAPGKLADFVLVDGDPTTTISDVRRPVLVGKAGVLYRPADLYRALGIRP
jgi:hypothetical protein